MCRFLVGNGWSETKKPLSEKILGWTSNDELKVKKKIIPITEKTNNVIETVLKIQNTIKNICNAIIEYTHHLNQICWTQAMVWLVQTN